MSRRMQTRTIVTLLIFICIYPCSIYSQIHPAEDCKLNYRLIGFIFPKENNANHYLLEVSSGHTYSDDSFRKNIVQRIDVATNRVIATVPRFGAAYTWRVVYTISHSKTVTGKFYHFATGIVPDVDTNNIRLRITEHAKKYNDAYVFVDVCKTMYDMEGHPVWFLPEKAEFDAQNSDQRDLKMTPQGTITFLSITKAFEITYDGTILWRGHDNGAVSGDTTEQYHHELTRLQNGHYMVMGEKNEPVYIKTTKRDNHVDSSLFIGNPDIVNADYTRLYDARMFGTVIEYDEHGKMVWNYKTSRYFTGSDMINHVTPYGDIDLKVHDNSFYFDEANKMLYISMRDISRIIKIKYPEGTTVNTYGKLFKPVRQQTESEDQYVPGGKQQGNGLFCGQHCCRCTNDEDLFLFNNDACHPGALPKIIVMKQPVSTTGTLEKIWEYQCKPEQADADTAGKLNYLSGGSVEELPDGSFFSSMSMGYSKLFIVNRNKEILWSTMVEKWNSYKKTWEYVSIYRASIVTDREQLERLIWGAEISE